MPGSRTNKGAARRQRQVQASSPHKVREEGQSDSHKAHHHHICRTKDGGAPREPASSHTRAHAQESKEAGQAALQAGCPRDAWLPRRPSCMQRPGKRAVPRPAGSVGGGGAWRSHRERKAMRKPTRPVLARMEEFLWRSWRSTAAKTGWEKTCSRRGGSGARRRAEKISGTQRRKSGPEAREEGRGARGLLQLARPPQHAATAGRPTGLGPRTGWARLGACAPACAVARRRPAGPARRCHGQRCHAQGGRASSLTW